ncbi:MAG: N-acetyltransferase [Bacteroidales bacterium]|nr:N-acetyltransferase [Bacteroidales bacterium]
MIDIRKANEADYPVIDNITERTFEHVQCNNEHLSLAKTCNLDIFIPELSLVAAISGNRIVGHIYFVRVSIGFIYPSLALAQVVVVPEFQELGIGSLMVNKAHERAKELGYSSIISLGYRRFLSRLGYRSLSGFGIYFPYGIVEDQCVAIELYPGSLRKINGMVSFPLELL